MKNKQDDVQNSTRPKEKAKKNANVEIQTKMMKKRTIAPLNIDAIIVLN